MPAPPPNPPTLAPPFAVWPDLILFYLLGCAFRDGATSLRQAAGMVLARQDAGRVPADIGCSKTNASRTLFRLGGQLFGPRYGSENLSLLTYEEGKAGTLAAAGWRAWGEAGDFLERHGLRPAW